MKTVIDKANTRGYFNHGWLKTYHTFSFADYYNPRRIHFGALRVLNDDTVAPGEGFGMHPHKNMEVVSIPLQGYLRHGDSVQNESTIAPGEIQVMSTGIANTMPVRLKTQNSCKSGLFPMWRELNPNTIIMTFVRY